MAKRYGRKQRAQHRAKVAELTRRLDIESTMHMYLPGDVPGLEGIARVLGYSVTESGGRGNRIELSATLTVEATAGIIETIADRTPVQFMGKQYIVVDGKMEQGAYIGGPEHLELELVGVAS